MAMIKAYDVLMVVFSVFFILNGVLLLLTERVPRRFARAVMLGSDVAWIVAAAAAMAAAVAMVEVAAEALR